MSVRRRFMTMALPLSLACALLASTVGAIAPNGPFERVAYVVALGAVLATLITSGLQLPGGAGSALVIFAFAAVGLIGLPARLLTMEPSLAEPEVDVALSLAFWVAALGAVGLGASLVGRRNSSPVRAVTALAPAARFVVVTAVSIGGLAIILVSAGGPAQFLGSLDRTGETTAGLTFAVVMVLAAKFAALARLHSRWAGGAAGVTRADIAWLIAALVLIALLGSRLLLLVACSQVAILALLHDKVSRRRLPFACALVLLVVGVGVGYGELRRWQATPRVVSLVTFLRDEGLPRLPRTIVNQYADAIKLSDTAMRVVPDQVGFEGGRGLLRVIVHPIPSQIRPQVGRADAVDRSFTASATTGNALPVPVEGWLQAGTAGVLFLSALFGVLLGWSDRLARGKHSSAVAFAAACGAASLLMMFRGSLPQGTTLAALDIAGLYAVHRLVIRSAPEPAA